MFKIPSVKGLLVLGLSLGLTACNTKTDSEFKTQEAGKTVAPAQVSHEHGNGPHGGPLAHLGSYMAELVFTADPRAIAVYVTDHDDLTKAIALEAKSMTLELEGGSSPLTLSADPQDGDEEGKASKFVVMGDAIPESIKSLEDIEGHVKVDAGGKTLEAEFHHDEDEAEKGK